MITGTLYEAGKMMVMQNKWEQKKSTGNINKKEKKELTPQEMELQRYKGSDKGGLWFLLVKV